MKTCPTCSTILPDDPYRSTTITIQHKSKALFGKTIYTIKKILSLNAIAWLSEMIVGIGAIAAVAMLGWCLVCGVEKLGKYVGYDIMHWSMGGVWWNGVSGVDPFLCWLFGIGLILSLFGVPMTVFWFLPTIGKSMIKMIKKQMK